VAAFAETHSMTRKPRAKTARIAVVPVTSQRQANELEDSRKAGSDGSKKSEQAVGRATPAPPEKTLAPVPAELRHLTTDPPAAGNKNFVRNDGVEIDDSPKTPPKRAPCGT
jgi:hypothetical protein